MQPQMGAFDCPSGPLHTRGNEHGLKLGDLCPNPGCLLRERPLLFKEGFDWDLLWCSRCSRTWDLIPEGALEMEEE
eukprot:g4364.t1